MAEPWQILVVVGVLLALAEIFTPSFVALPAGLAFLMTGAVAPLIASEAVLLALLSFNLLLVFGVFKRFVWPRLQKGAPKTAADGMVGKVVTVTDTIDPAVGAGYVKLYGDSWQAVSQEKFEKGARVVIVGMDGNKVVVAAETPEPRGV